MGARQGNHLLPPGRGRRVNGCHDVAVGTIEETPTCLSAGGHYWSGECPRCSRQECHGDGGRDRSSGSRAANGQRGYRGSAAGLADGAGKTRGALPGPPSDRHFREGGKPEIVETDSRFRGNDGEGCGNDGSIDRGACPRESGGMAESWRAGPFALHPPPGLPPARGGGVKMGPLTGRHRAGLRRIGQGEVKMGAPARGEECNRRWMSLADKQEPRWISGFDWGARGFRAGRRLSTSGRGPCRGRRFPPASGTTMPASRTPAGR